MKFLLTLFIIICFFVLLCGSIYFYRNFYPQIINSPRQNEQSILTSTDKGIYFYADNQLFIINPDLTLNRLADLSTLQIIDNFNSNDINISGQNIIYLDTNNQAQSIYSFNLKTNSKKELVNLNNPSLSTYQEMTKPVLSPDKLSVIFIVKNSTRSDLFSYNLTSGAISNLNNSLNFDEIHVQHNKKSIGHLRKVLAVFAIFHTLGHFLLHFH